VFDNLQSIADSASSFFTSVSAHLGDFDLPFHDFGKVGIIMSLIQARNYSGAETLNVSCWQSMEKILPHTMNIAGHNSITVAGILMHLLNVYENLSSDMQFQYANRLIKYGEQMQVVAQNGSNIIHGNKFVLPFWKDSDTESGHEGLDKIYLEAEAANHMASAMQNKEDFKSAEAMYKHAIALAEGADHMRLATGFWANLSTLHEAIALPAFRPSAFRALTNSSGQRSRAFSKKIDCNPEVFNKFETYHLNEAFRCALKRLRASQTLHGTTHHSTGDAHENIAGLCFQARKRKPAIYHVERAKLIKTACYGPDHNLTKSINKLYNQLTKAYPTSAPLVLDADVKEGLSKHVSGTRCDYDGCTAQETDDLKFKLCSRCRVAKFCSVECQKLAWPNHKKFACERTALVQDERDEEYKQKQKEFGEMTKKSQEKYTK
jgi:hypothetical protein